MEQVQSILVHLGSPFGFRTLIHTRTYKLWRFQLGTADLGAVEPQTKLQASLASRTLGLLGSEGGGPWFRPVDLFCAAKNYTKLEFQPIVGPKCVLKVCWAGRLWSSSVKLQDFGTVCATGIRCNDLQCTLYILAVLDLVFFLKNGGCCQLFDLSLSFRLASLSTCAGCQRVSSCTPKGINIGINIPCRFSQQKNHHYSWIYHSIIII